MTDHDQHHRNGSFSIPNLLEGNSGLGTTPSRVMGNGHQHVAPPEPDVDALVKSLRDQVIRKPDKNRSQVADRYPAFAEAVDDLIFVVDLAGRVEYANKALANLLETSAEDLLGRSYEDLSVLPAEEAENLLIRVITDEQVVRYEVAMQSGCVGRYYYATLSPTRDADGCITGILGIAKDVSEIARAREELRSLSLVDELTGVYNRRGFVSLGAQHLSLARRTGSRVCLVLADMDSLKAINDRFGHPHGDAALAALAAIMRGSCRESDIVARIGGDEFVLLATGVSDGGSARLVSRLQEGVEAENARRPYFFSASIGAVECAPDRNCSIDMLLEEADKMMYTVKRGRSTR